MKHLLCKNALMFRRLLLPLLLLALGCDTSGEGCAEGDEQCEKISNFCSNVTDCEEIQMLISEDQCRLQTARRLGKAGHASRECRDPSTEPTSSADEKKDPTAAPDPDAERACIRAADPCAACITDLTCAGMAEVANGKVDILSLCPGCDRSLSVRGSTPYLVVPGLAAAPPEVEEGESEEESAEEPEKAPEAAPPAKPAPQEATPAQDKPPTKTSTSGS